MSKKPRLVKKGVDPAGGHFHAAKGKVRMEAGIPVSVELLDLGGGIRTGVNEATPLDILSVPMAAILRGMTAMRWPAYPPVAVGGFPGMVAEAATHPRKRPNQARKKSFAVLGAPER